MDEQQSMFKDSPLVMVPRKSYVLLAEKKKKSFFPHQETVFLEMKDAEWKLKKYSPRVIKLPNHRHLAVFYVS